MPNTTETGSSPSTKAKGVLAVANKWLIWRFAALCFWYWFLALRGQELSLPALQYVGLLAIIPVLRQFLHRRWWLGLLAIPGAGVYYFVGFPFVGVYWCARIAKRVFAVPLRALHFITSATGFLLAFLVFALLLLVIPAIRNPMPLAILGYMNLAVINALFLCGLAWSSNPLAPVLFISKQVWGLLNWYVENSRKEQPTSKASAQTSLSIARSIRGFLSNHIVDDAGQLLNVDRLKRYIAPLFASVVLMLFLILVSGYALTYYALQRSGVDVLPGLGNAPTLGAAWYHSLTISTAALHQGVIPDSSIGQLIQSLHLIDAAMFFTSALFLFSYAMGDHGKQELHHLRNYPKRIVAKIDGWIEDLQLPEALPVIDQDTIDVEGHEETENNVDVEAQS